MKTLAHYEILEELGRGGFAVVYKARDTTLDRVVALKVLHPQLTTDPKFIQRFQQEAQTAAGLRHPHIVTIHEVGEEGGQHYLAMSFIPGHTLDERLSATKGPLPVELAISIVEQIANALDTIHQQGLVHRDVKPANVMVDSKGQATLLDFGIVRAAEGTRLTTSMAILGTPEYMAPEQAELEEGVDIDWRADIYALGVAAYEMLVGQPPFTGKSPTAVLYKHVHEPPPEPTTLNPNLPARLEPVLLKALAKGQEERFQRAGDFAATLCRALLTDSQILQREAQLAPLYQQLQAAAAQGDWRGVLVLGSQIQALDASYRDVSQQMAHAHQQLRQPQREPAQPPPAQPALRERAEEPERKTRRAPALNWRVAGLSALAVLVCICLIAGTVLYYIIFPPEEETPTPTENGGPPSTSTAADTPTPSSTATPTPTPTATPTDTPMPTSTDTPTSTSAPNPGLGIFTTHFSDSEVMMATHGHTVGSVSFCAFHNLHLVQEDVGKRLHFYVVASDAPEDKFSLRLYRSYIGPNEDELDLYYAPNAEFIESTGSYGDVYQGITWVISAAGDYVLCLEAQSTYYPDMQGSSVSYRVVLYGN